MKPHIIHKASYNYEYCATYHRDVPNFDKWVVDHIKFTRELRETWFNVDNDNTILADTDRYLVVYYGKCIQMFTDYKDEPIPDCIKQWIALQDF